MKEYAEIYRLVQTIPTGKVASYGQIALLLGRPRWARVIGYAMACCDNAAIPCHRVVYQDGSLATAFGADGQAEQRALLLGEHVAFLPDGRVDMIRCRWQG